MKALGLSVGLSVALFLLSVEELLLENCLLSAADINLLVSLVDLLGVLRLGLLKITLKVLDELSLILKNFLSFFLVLNRFFIKVLGIFDLSCKDGLSLVPLTVLLLNLSSSLVDVCVSLFLHNLSNLSGHLGLHLSGFESSSLSLLLFLGLLKLNVGLFSSFFCYNELSHPLGIFLSHVFHEFNNSFLRFILWLGRVWVSLGLVLSSSSSGLVLSRFDVSLDLVFLGLLL